MQRRGTLYVLASLVLACCGDDWNPAEAARLAEPHMRSFTKFDAWVRRSLSSDPAFPTREALEETIFAPLRSEDSVAAAWITDDKSQHTLSMDETVLQPANLSWMTVRSDGLGAVRVARSTLAARGSADTSTTGVECVLIEKNERVASTQTVRITAAYLVPAR